ncbi:hypothetical protein AURANDRAFT_69024 [Aureococcus anophagefferens]|uniref:Uncharacterized protein n=1 Tax=Aureococcus anophagefferens TaxID=44056 RepID=F0YRH6_AURAN|nr:hypothetical protein AURANDRAFT_69024 [Aureococcus anophagefferens]EGB02283.1 hypothetical protein AURANDRAFT_69024 [Aureococcus anophagefferens]|eukprot:XP_009043017.1 hypothetical protein AURANDRAFT_69024 [Aureococcus anophagefferens]
MGRRRDMRAKCVGGVADTAGAARRAIFRLTRRLRTRGLPLRPPRLLGRAAHPPASAASREWFQTMTHLLAAKNETTHLLKVYDAPPAPVPDAPTSPNEFNLSEKLRNWSPGNLSWRALHTTRHPRVGVPDFGVASLCDWIIFRENGTCGFRTYLVRRRRVPRTVWLGNRNFYGRRRDPLLREPRAAASDASRGPLQRVRGLDAPPASRRAIRTERRRERPRGLELAPC